jgi:RNA polymerase sigma-70 factor (ECF subfamily)
MDELQEKQRESILMAYYYGNTHEEIAKKLAAPLGTVKAWVRRGIERLRKCLE